MKIRLNLLHDPSTLKETIEEAKRLHLEANPDYELTGVNINPLQLDENRRGRMELDLILDEKKK